MHGIYLVCTRHDLWVEDSDDAPLTGFPQSLMRLTEQEEVDDLITVIQVTHCPHTVLLALQHINTLYCLPCKT